MTDIEKQFLKDLLTALDTPYNDPPIIFNLEDLDQLTRKDCLKVVRYLISKGYTKSP